MVNIFTITVSTLGKGAVCLASEFILIWEACWRLVELIRICLPKVNFFGNVYMYIYLRELYLFWERWLRVL